MAADAELTRWEVDPEGIEALAAEPGVTAYLRQLAEQAVAVARNLAPVVSGRYRDSLRVIEAHGPDGQPLVGFGSDAFDWHFVEYGSAHQAPQRVLSNAALAVAERVELG